MRDWKLVEANANDVYVTEIELRKDTWEKCSTFFNENTGTQPTLRFVSVDTAKWLWEQYYEVKRMKQNEIGRIMKVDWEPELKRKCVAFSFLCKLKKVIEDLAVQLDDEYDCRDVEQLVKDGTMPDVYYELLKELEE